MHAQQIASFFLRVLTFLPFSALFCVLTHVWEQFSLSLFLPVHGGSGGIGIQSG
jgi:hypothetical protein